MIDRVEQPDRTCLGTANQEIYRGLVEGTDDLMARVDLEDNFVFVNGAARHIFGLQPADCIGLSALSFVHPDDRERTRQAMAEWARLGVPGAIFENRQVSRSGQIRHMLWTVSVVHGPDGAPAGLNGIACDITERKRVEQTLRDRELNYRLLVENQQELIAKYDTHGRLLFVSPSFCEAFGGTESQLLDTLFGDLVGEQNDIPTDDLPVNASHGFPEHVRRHEGRVRMVHGQRWLSWTERAILDADGRIEAFVTTGRDITGRKAAEEALRQSEERFRAIADYTCDWEDWVGEDGRLLWVNPAVKQLTGYTEEECLAMPDYPLQLVVPEDRDRMADHFRAAALGCTGHNVEMRVVRKDGKAKWVGTSWRPIFNAQQVCIGRRSSYRDIDVRKGHEVELQQHRDNLEHLVRQRTAELQELNVSLQNEMVERQRVQERERRQQAELAHVSRLTTIGEMASGLAHEVMQPLGAVCTYADACNRMLNASQVSELPATLAKLGEQARRAANIIKRVQSFTRKRDAQHGRVNLNELVLETCGLTEFETRNAKVNLARDLHPELGALVGDALRIQQVIVNLLLNALDAVRTRPESDRRVVVRTRPAETGVEIVVEDNGCGVPHEIAGRVFEPFFSTKPGGMGLGLSISASIVEEHAGQLWVDPLPDGGSAFHVVLPGH